MKLYQIIKNYFFADKKISSIINNWGNLLEKHRNFDLISIYHSYLANQPDQEYVDEKTWSDLNFNSIFSLFDRTISSIGQQFLYHLLHKYETNENKLKDRISTANYLNKNSKARETIQISLLNVSDIGSYYISNILWGIFPSIPKYYFVIYILSAISILSLFLVFINTTFLFLLIMLGLVNLIVNKIYTEKTYEYFLALSSLNKLISSSIQITKVESTVTIEQIENLKKYLPLLEKLRKKVGYLVIDKSSLNEIVLTIVEYLNLFFLFDFVSYIRTIKALEDNIIETRQIFNSVAELDAIISLGSYIEEKKNLCSPLFVEASTLTFLDLYHPLINNPVPNSVENLDKSALITGSNMAGKTTFIKTIGINLILSQTLYISHAKNFVSFPFIVKSSIKREDALETSKSYFFVEIEQLKDFIKLSENKSNYLFLIDEIFRGTNTIERLSSSTAVLDYLSKNSFVLVTTHVLNFKIC